MNKKILFILIITIVSFQLVVFSIQKHESSSWLGLFRWIAIPFHRGWLVVQNGLDQVVSNFTSKSDSNSRIASPGPRGSRDSRTFVRGESRFSLDSAARHSRVRALRRVAASEPAVTRAETRRHEHTQDNPRHPSIPTPQDASSLHSRDEPRNHLYHKVLESKWLKTGFSRFASFSRFTPCGARRTAQLPEEPNPLSGIGLQLVPERRRL